MRILIADNLQAFAVSALEAAGHECVVDADLTADSLPEHVAKAEVLIVRSTRVTSATIEAADSLRLIVRAGAGTNTIDVSAATSAGVVVTNVPGRNSAAVAELTLGLMLAIDRRIPDAVMLLRDGKWDKKGLGKSARGLKGGSLGIVGLGSIGLGVAERASAFGMKLFSLHRASRSPETESRIRQLEIELVDSLPTLATRVDFLTLHVPSGAETKGLVDEHVLNAMPQGAVLINTSRADVVDNEALLQALDAGRIRAGLDVFPDEPGSGTAEWTSQLASHPAVVGTHHVGASTQEAQRAVAEGVVDVVAAFADGNPVHVVNQEALPGRGAGG